MAASKHHSFLRRLPLAMIAATLLWLLLRPGIDLTVAKLSQILIRSFEYPKVTRLVVEDHRARVHRADFRSDSAIPTVSMTEITFNTIVLLALYLALPKPFSRRQLESLFMGWTILLLSQSLNLVFHVKTMYAMSLGEWSQAHYSDAARNFWGYLRYFTDLPGRFSFPFLIWLGFNWEPVMKMLRPIEETRATTKKRAKK